MLQGESSAQTVFGVAQQWPQAASQMYLFEQTWHEELEITSGPIQRGNMPRLSHYLNRIHS